MDLADHIRQYFFTNFDRLTPSRGFHFASRLASWEGSSEAIKRLRELRGYMLSPSSNRFFPELLNNSLGPIYGENSRRKYFYQYPRLHGFNNSLFRIRHLKEFYGIDLRDDFLMFVEKHELEVLADQLLNDMSALKWLSSFAVNYLYLLEKLYGWPLNEPALFLGLYQSFDFKDPEQLNLLIYLFTHCVIADSNFYSDRIPADRLEVYRKMMERLHKLLQSKQDEVKLDAKLEYLVAHRICGQEPPLQGLIQQQMARHLSEDGGYIIDTKSLAQNMEINSLDVSEHRNVLYIMSASEFHPHKVKI